METRTKIDFTKPIETVNGTPARFKLESCRGDTGDYLLVFYGKLQHIPDLVWVDKFGCTPTDPGIQFIRNVAPAIDPDIVFNPAKPLEGVELFGMENNADDPNAGAWIYVDEVYAGAWWTNNLIDSNAPWPTPGTHLRLKATRCPEWRLSTLDGFVAGVRCSRKKGKKAVEATPAVDLEIDFNPGNPMPGVELKSLRWNDAADATAGAWIFIDDRHAGMWNPDNTFKDEERTGVCAATPRQVACPAWRRSTLQAFVDRVRAERKAKEPTYRPWTDRTFPMDRPVWLRWKLHGAGQSLVTSVSGCLHAGGQTLTYGALLEDWIASFDGRTWFPAGELVGAN